MPEVGSRDRRPPGESRGRGAQPHPGNRSQVCRGEVFVWPGATRKQPGGLRPRKQRRQTDTSPRQT